MTPRQLIWYSCGASSAVCVKLLADERPVAVYCDMSRDEHPDNMRFTSDVERWTGVPVEVIRGDHATTDDVFRARRYMGGVSGAPCTVEMKKVPRFRFQRHDDLHVFGFTADEPRRAASLAAANPELSLRFPLIERGLVKSDCLRMLREAGIALPAMYGLGFDHNNCIGCVKATSPRYWNLVRRHFPAKFASRASLSREIGARLVRVRGERVFLDELPIDDQTDLMDDLACGPQCASEPTP